MKKIAIQSTYTLQGWDENSYDTGGIGGSEIWAIKVADEFAKRGYSVYLFGNPNEVHTSSTGVRYFKSSDYKYISENFEFDYFIFSRIFPDNIDKVLSKNIFIMAHNFNIGYMPSEYVPGYDRVKKILCLSKYQREFIKELYKYVKDDRLAYVRNGVDGFLYEKYNNIPQKNQMVCSNGKYRQALWIVTYVFPLIKKEIPDFELLLCSYDETFEEPVFHQDGIRIIGDSDKQITREDLIKAQCESKIWVYANTSFWGLDNNYHINETFCITALEAACSKSAIIVGEKSPFPETLAGYDHFLGKELFHENILSNMPIENQEKFASILANESIKCLKDEEYRQTLVKKAYPIGMKSSWKNAVDYIENEITKV